MDCKAQTAIEYLLLVALGLAILFVGIVLATQIKSFIDQVLSQSVQQRNETLSMLVR